MTAASIEARDAFNRVLHERRTLRVPDVPLLARSCVDRLALANQPEQAVPAGLSPDHS
jgi:hypothetical protein